MRVDKEQSISMENEIMMCNMELLSKHGEPKNFKEAYYGTKKEFWIPSMKKEIENFTKKQLENITKKEGKKLRQNTIEGQMGVQRKAESWWKH